MSHSQPVVAQSISSFVDISRKHGSGQPLKWDWYLLCQFSWLSPHGHKMAATARGITFSHTTSCKSRKQGGVKKEAHSPLHFSFLPRSLKTPSSWRVSLTRRTESHAYPILIPSKGDIRYGCYRNSDSFLGTDCNLLGF